MGYLPLEYERTRREEKKVRKGKERKGKEREYTGWK